MPVKLVFLGKLEDLAGRAEMRVSLDGALSLSEILAQLSDDLAASLRGPKVKLALNGTLLPPGADPTLADGDELAFLPPVSGG